MYKRQSDGWEVRNGLDPLDNGQPAESEIPFDSTDNEDDTGEQNETFPNPDNGPYGDPDRDGLTNTEEAALGTKPMDSDSDDDGLNDKWESMYVHEIDTPAGVLRLLDPLNANRDCYFLTPDGTINSQGPEMREQIRNELTNAEYDMVSNADDEISCDAALDLEQPTPDGLRNFVEERYDTNPLEEDSDGDLIADRHEIAFGYIELGVHCGVPVFGTLSLQAPYTEFMSEPGDLTWFEQDMDLSLIHI